MLKQLLRAGTHDKYTAEPAQEQAKTLPDRREDVRRHHQKFDAVRPTFDGGIAPQVRPAGEIAGQAAEGYRRSLDGSNRERPMSAPRLESARTALRQPAYANRIHEMRRKGLAPQLMVWVVDGWEPFEDDGQFGDWIVVVQPDMPVELVDFRCLVGLDVLIQAPTRQRVQNIAEQVHRFQPRQLWGWPEAQRRLTYFERRAA